MRGPVPRSFAAFAALVLLAVPSLGQMPQTPVPSVDLGPVAQAADQAAGDLLVPAVAAAYEALGQNITREDVRIAVDLNLTKGTVGIGGLLLGSGTVEVQAAVHARVELRVISSDRIRELLASGGNSNATAQNLTFLQGLYLPAEAFRASLTAEGLAAFQAAEEAFLRDYLSAMVPELHVLGLDLTWSNTLPTHALTDLSLTEPPIVVELDMTAQYLRIESIPSLLETYLEASADPSKEGRDAYIDRLKAENAAPRAERDFLGAAAYDQLLNLSMQPGWSLDLGVHLPRGYEFTYFSDEAHHPDARSVELLVDARSSDADVQEVFVASVTQPKAVALALLVALLVGGLIASGPGRLLYWRFRLPRLARGLAAASAEAAAAPAGAGAPATPGQHAAGASSNAAPSAVADGPAPLRNLVAEGRAADSAGVPAVAPAGPGRPGRGGGAA